MENITLTKNQIIEVLTRSPHGKLEEYVPIGRAAAAAEPEFLAHLIAWNQIHGAIRDSKIALPVLSLGQPTFTGDLAENSLAHIASQDPRNFVRALDYARSVGTQGTHRQLRRLVQAYLRQRESSWGLWERAVVQHRASLKTLYARYHVKPGSEAFNKALFKGEPPVGSTLWIISQLSKMSPTEALGHVLTRKIPFLVAIGALGAKLKEPDVVLALINSMSDAELTNNAKMLDKLGVKTNPALRSAFRSRLEALGQEQEVKTGPALLKASVAAAALGDSTTAAALNRAQERQIKATGGVKGRWLIAGDKSQSMGIAIEVTQFIAGHLARVAEAAELVWFDTTPYHMQVSGKTLEQIKEICRHVRPQGGTIWSAAIDYMSVCDKEVDGVAFVSDGGDNPAHNLRGRQFVAAWKEYCAKIGKEPTLYFFKVKGEDPDTISPVLQRAGVSFELFDLTRGVDYFSLPNLIATMNTRRWSLLDQIMAVPLLKLTDVFTKETRNAATATA